MVLTPSLGREIEQRMLEDLSQRTGISQVSLARSVEGHIVSTSAAEHMIHQRNLAFALNQISWLTSDSEQLDRFAEGFVGGRSSVSRATGTIAVTTTELGTVMPQGTQWTHGGVTYVTVSEVTFAALVETVMIQSVEFGLIGNRDASSVFSLASSIANIDQEGPTVDAVNGGIEAEEDDELRSRISRHFRSRGRRGTPTDYISIAETSIANGGAGLRDIGFDRVWVIPTPGNVRMVAVKSAELPTLPSAEDLQQALDRLIPFRPAAAGISIEGPSSLVILNPAVTINPNTQLARDAATAAMEEFVNNIPLGGEIDLNLLEAAVTGTAAVISANIDFLVGIPAADIDLALTELAFLGFPIYTS